jgi:tetratricopeptide (TPR) repeat protein
LSLESRKAARIEDPGAEMIDRARDAYDRYGRLVLGALAAVVVVAALVFFWTRSRQNNEAAAAAKLAEASATFWQGDYPRSTELARQVAQQWGSTRSGADAHRLLGDNAYWTGDVKTAITEYRAYLAKEKSGVLADAARRSLAYALETDGQHVEAAKTYEQIVGAFDRESSAEFLVAASRCYEAAGQREPAIASLRRLLDEYADTTYSIFARMKLAELQTAAG